MPPTLSFLGPARFWAAVAPDRRFFGLLVPSVGRRFSGLGPNWRFLGPALFRTGVGPGRLFFGLIRF